MTQDKARWIGVFMGLSLIAGLVLYTLAWEATPSEPEMTLKPGIHHPVDAPWLSCWTTKDDKVMCVDSWSQVHMFPKGND